MRSHERLTVDRPTTRFAGPRQPAALFLWLLET